MSSDRTTNRSLAIACAVAGLVVLMIQDTPNWPAVGIASACLVACGAFWFLPEARPARRPVPRRIHVEILAPERPEPPPLDLLEGRPRALEWLGPGKPVSKWSQRRWQAPRGS